MHPQMAMNIEECVDLTHLKDKITAIIPTSNAGIECLLWAVFSLLLRNKPHGMLEHICVNINGPDERTGDPKPQDVKQKFLEELRDLDWFHTGEIGRQMPLTVIRAWSRVGYAEALEMALSWVHTDSYLCMHDDVILINPEWLTELKTNFYDDPDVAIAYTPKLLGCNCDYAIHRGMYLLRLPQIDTTFLVAKKRWTMKAGASWTGYHIPSDDNFLQFEISELPDQNEFFKYYEDRDLMPEKIQTVELYNFVRQEIGAWLYYKLCQLGAKFTKLKEDNIIHFEQMSNTNAETANKKMETYKTQIIDLENEIMAHPAYSELYVKYMPGGPRYA
jgi:hypothetical protein